MKYITFNEESKVFTLRTKYSMYQMQVRDYGTLVHVYYGENIGDTEAAYRIICLDRDFPAIHMKRGKTAHFPWMCCRRSIPGTAMGTTGSMPLRWCMKTAVTQRTCVMNLTA